MVTQHVINKPSCEGLQKSCPRAEREKKISNCECDHRVFREPTTEEDEISSFPYRPKPFHQSENWCTISHIK